MWNVGCLLCRGIQSTQKCNLFAAHRQSYHNFSRVFLLRYRLNCWLLVAHLPAILNSLQNTGGIDGISRFRWKMVAFFRKVRTGKCKIDHFQHKLTCHLSQKSTWKFWYIQLSAQSSWWHFQQSGIAENLVLLSTSSKTKFHWPADCEVASLVERAIGLIIQRLYCHIGNYNNMKSFETFKFGYVLIINLQFYTR